MLSFNNNNSPINFAGQSDSEYSPSSSNTSIPLSAGAASKEASIGLGLGLPSGVLQRSQRAVAFSSLSQMSRSHLPFPPTPRPASAPLNIIPESERLSLRRASVNALIGLGIYVPNTTLPGQNRNERPSWCEDDQSIHNYAIEDVRPLLPTRRSSPHHITTIIDDDVEPPMNPVFTPREDASEFLPPPAPRIPYQEAPPAEDLPIPFAPDVTINTSTNMMVGLGLTNIDFPVQSTISIANSSSETDYFSITSASSFMNSSDSNSSYLSSFDFEPFSPLIDENDSVYHLPSDLLSPDIPLPMPFSRKGENGVGLGFSGVLYETE